MRIKWREAVIATIAAVVLWIALASAAHAQSCPDRGWLLAGGTSSTTIAAPMADGPLSAWTNEGWLYSSQVKVVVEVVPAGVVIRSYMRADSTEAWSERETFLLRPHKLTPCLFKSETPVTTNAAGEDVYLFLGYVEALARHEHADVQTITPRPSTVDVRKS